MTERTHPWFHATRGELLLRLGRGTDAAAAFDRALEGLPAHDAPVARRIRRRRAIALG